MNIDKLIKELKILADSCDSYYALEVNGYSQGVNDAIGLVRKLTIPVVSDTLIAWQQFRDANWYESESVDVDKMLMDKFQDFYQQYLHLRK